MSVRLSYKQNVGEKHLWVNLNLDIHVVFAIERMIIESDMQ